MKIGIIDFRGHRAIGATSEVALHQSKTLIPGLFKQPLNGELGEVFKRWYPDMQVEELAEAA